MSLLDILSALRGAQPQPQAGGAGLGSLLAMLGGQGAADATPQGDQAPSQAAAPDPGANPTPSAPQHSVTDLLTPFMQQTAAQPQRLGLGDILGTIGATLSQASGANPDALAEQQLLRRGQAGQQQSAQQRAALFQMARALNLPPAVQMMFAADPEGTIAKMRDQKYGFHDLDAGHTGIFGDPTQGGSAFTAPKVENGEGYTFNYDPTQGNRAQLQDLSGLQQSPQQVQAAADKQAEDDEKQRHNAAEEDYWKQLGAAATTKAAKYKSGPAAGPAAAWALPPGFRPAN
jgi:hypothetical protein